VIPIIALTPAKFLSRALVARIVGKYFIVETETFRLATSWKLKGIKKVSLVSSPSERAIFF
jgi:hypothetical protein